MGNFKNSKDLLSLSIPIPILITNSTLSHVISKTRNFASTDLVLICTFFLLIWSLQYLWKRRFMYYHSWNIPGPFAFPLIGCAYVFFSPNTSDLMEAIINLQKKFPDLTRIWLGPKLYFFVTKPEQIKKIISNPNALDKDHLYRFISAGVGEGLLTAKVQKWRKHKKAIMPAFNQKALDDFQKIFTQKGEVFAAILQNQSGNKDLDLHKLVSNCTLDSICETSMGLKLNIQHKNSEIPHQFDKLMEMATYRIFHLWHHLEFTWNWYPIGKQFNKLLKELKDFTNSVVEKKLNDVNKKKYLKKSLKEKAKEETPKTLAFLDIIIENSNFTKEELREEVDLFLAAGTDTIASTLCFIFVMLGMFPDVQQKLLEEIVDVMGERTPIPSDLSQMKYTERVIKECLRLFPVVSFFARRITEDIETDDLTFPAGSSAFFATVHIHRNPKYWPDPLKFDPDRFLPENVEKRHPCTYIPFSYGPRNCIGTRYAMINMKTTLAIVLRKVNIFTKYEKVEDVKLKTNLILRMKDGPQVWVENRK